MSVCECVRVCVCVCWGLGGCRGVFLCVSYTDILFGFVGLLFSKRCTGVCFCCGLFKCVVLKCVPCAPTVCVNSVCVCVFGVQWFVCMVRCMLMCSEVCVCVCVCVCLCSGVCVWWGQ